MDAPSDERVKRFILDVLDDLKRHDWDEAMIEVDIGFETHGEHLGVRQSWTCLEALIAAGLVVEEPHRKWSDMLTLRRIRQHSESTQLSLFPAVGAT